MRCWAVERRLYAVPKKIYALKLEHVGLLGALRRGHLLAVAASDVAAQVEPGDGVAHHLDAAVAEREEDERDAEPHPDADKEAPDGDDKEDHHDDEVLDAPQPEPALVERVDEEVEPEMRRSGPEDGAREVQDGVGADEEHDAADRRRDQP